MASCDDTTYFEVPFFGVWHLNITEAAALTVKSLWLEGELDFDGNVPDEESYNLYSPSLEKALSKPIADYEHIFLSAIENKTLPTVKLARNLNEKILPKETFISSEALVNWLYERKIQITNTEFYNDYLNAESDIADVALKTVTAARIKIKQSASSRLGSETLDSEKILLVEENRKLKKELEKLKENPEAHKPISERQQGAYLNIIGALLGLLLGKSPSGKPYSDFKNQQALIDAIHGNFGEASGLSKRNLEDKFALARRTLRVPLGHD